MSDGRPWIIRPYEAADLQLIFDAWLKSYWHGINNEPWPMTFGTRGRVGLVSVRFNRDDFYNPGQRAMISACIADAGCVVAHQRSDPDELYGFACGTGARLHYVYVKEHYRRVGCGSDLLAAVIGPASAEVEVKASHMTGQLNVLMSGRRWVFEPNFRQKKSK